MQPDKDMLVRSMLADAAYENYVTEAGITGKDDFDIVGKYCCGGVHQPCTNFPIVSVYFFSLTCPTICSARQLLRASSRRSSASLLYMFSVNADDGYGRCPYLLKLCVLT